MDFARTSNGKVNKFLFHNVPIVWVEGEQDVIFFNEMLSGITDYKLESTTSIEESEKLEKNLIENDYPYIVIRDGDYFILSEEKEVHTRIIRLDKYSIENYLFEQYPIEYLCCVYSKMQIKKNLLNVEFSKLINDINKSFYDLVMLDIAARIYGKGFCVLPKIMSSLCINP